MDKQSLITTLQLQPHPKEGGFFRRTYESDVIVTVKGAQRKLMTSIYYLLTDCNPIGYLHRNLSDIVHYYQLGCPMNYLIVSPHGELSTYVLGPELLQGQQLQLTVKGGYWKASWLAGGEFALISEAVAPGFQYHDNELAQISHFSGLPADSIERILPYLKDKT